MDQHASIARSLPSLSIREAGAAVDMERMHRYRLDRLQAELAAEDCVALLLFGTHHLRYATGTVFSAIFNTHKPMRAVFVPADGLITLFDWLGDPDAVLPSTIGEVRPLPLFNYFPAGARTEGQAETFAREVAQMARAAGGDRVALDISDPRVVTSLLDEGITVVAADRLIEHANAIKNTDEIMLLANACSVSSIAMARLHEELRAGMTELEAWSILNQVNAAMGGEWIEYKLLKAGEAINPWVREATDRRIHAGELVAFDCGMVGPFGYSADVSRTFLCGPGRATPAQKRLYAFAVENIEHNLELVKPGVSFEDFSKACWPYPEEFLKHRYPIMAHGIGMGDEWPGIPWPIDWEKEGYEGELQECMALCIESFIGSDKGGEGVKLEQQVVVTADGYELLSTFPWDEELWDG